MTPAFIAGTKERAEAHSNPKYFCDKNYYDGLADPRGYTDEAYDHRRGYGLQIWTDETLKGMRDLIKNYSIYTYLELGCGKGFNIQAARMQGIEAVGIDISAYSTSNCHPDMEPYILCRDATDLSIFKDKYFDYVTSWDFLEHLTLKDAEKCLKECRRVGKKHQYHGLTSFDKNYGSIAMTFPLEPQDPTHVSCFVPEIWDELFNKVFNGAEIDILHNKQEGRRTQSIYTIKEKN